MRIKTESGSVYELDMKGKRWARLSVTSESGTLRTEEGTFYNDPEVAVGTPLLLVCPPITPGADGRVIETTPVAEIIPEA